MISTAEIINALKNGRSVESCGNKVTADDIDYDWQTPKLRVNLKGGASYSLDGNERKAAIIIN